MRDRSEHMTKSRTPRKTVLALILAAVMLILPSAWGLASASDALKGPFTLNAGLGDNDSDILSDLRSTNLNIDLYKIADARQLSSFDTIEFIMKTNEDGTIDRTYGSLFSEELESITNKDVTSEEWEKIAQKAAAIALDPDLGTATQTADYSGKAEQDITLTSPGLYLVVPRGGDVNYVKKADDGTIVSIATSDYYEYSFTPQLISFPTKDPDENGVINTANAGEWLTDISINLKYKYEVRRGSLDIVKGLDIYETKDPATFAFKVEGRDRYNNVVFRNSYSMVFNKPGEQKITIDDLPAGTVITVTEEYEGANYRITSSKTADPVRIKAKDVVKTEFSNTYDDTYKGGGSIENVFTKGADGWEWYGIDNDGNKYDLTEKLEQEE